MKVSNASKVAKVILVLMSVLLVNSASAQVTCIQTYQAKANQGSLSFAPSDVEELVSQVSTAIGLRPVGITVIPCDGVGKVAANYYDRNDVPKGDYIFYDPIWVREVIGNKLVDPKETTARDQAIFLFGHELGHLLGRHFTSNAGLPRLQKETDADRFAGCAAGALGVKWENVENLLARIRGDVDSTYPSRQTAIAAASESFDKCQRAPQKIASPGIYTTSYPVIDVRYDLISDSYWAIRGQGKVEIIKSGIAKPILTVGSCGSKGGSPTAVAIVSFRDPTVAVACPDALRLVNLKTGAAADLSTGDFKPQVEWDSNLIDVGQYIVSKHGGSPCLFEWYLDWTNVKASKFVRKIQCESTVTSFSATNLYWLAIGTKDGVLRVFNESEGSVKYERKFNENYKESYQSNRIEGMQFWSAENHMSGLKIAFHTWGNIAYVIDVPNMLTYDALRFVYPVEKAVIFSSRLSHSGKLFALGTSDGAVTIWDVNTHELKGQYFHDAAVSDLRFNYDDDIVVSCGEDGTVRTFRVSTKQPVDVLQLQGRLTSIDLKSNRLIVGRGTTGNQDGPNFMAGEWKLGSSGKFSPL